MSSHIDGDNSINELEGLLEQVKNNEESVPMDSDHPGSFSAIEVEVDSENVDFNVENDRDLEDDVVENDMADECLEKDSEDIVESVSLKNKKEDNSRYRPLNLPLARIKQIIKMDPDVHLAGADAVFLIAKATELFIQTLSKEAYVMTTASKKKTMQKKDVDAAIANADALVFLDGALDF